MPAAWIGFCNKSSLSRGLAMYDIDALVSTRQCAACSSHSLQDKNANVCFDCGICSAMQALVLSTNSWMGGRNLFLGIMFLVAAVLSFLIAIGFLFAYHLNCFGLTKRRKFGDISQLSWNRKLMRDIASSSPRG